MRLTRFSKAFKDWMRWVMLDFQYLTEFYYIGIQTMLQNIDHEYDEGARVKKAIIRAVDLESVLLEDLRV